MSFWERPIDKLIDLQPGKSAVGIRSFSSSDSFFQNHFPGFPIVPGVLQVEMIAHVGGLCLRASNPVILPILSSIKSAKFYKKIEPGDQAIIKVEVIVRKSYSVAKGHVEVRDNRISKAEVMYAHIRIPEETMTRISAQEEGLAEP